MNLAASLSRYARLLLLTAVIIAGAASTIGSTYDEDTKTIRTASECMGATPVVLIADSSRVPQTRFEAAERQVITFIAGHGPADGVRALGGFTSDVVANVKWLRRDSASESEPWRVVQEGTSTEYVLQDLVYARDNGAQISVQISFFCSEVSTAGANVTAQAADPATISVLAGPTGWVDPAMPADLAVAEGNSATFSALAYGDNDYQWLVSNDNFVSTSAEVPGATSSTLQLSEVLAGGVQYRLRATSRVSGERILSRAANLSLSSVVIQPVITRQPADASVVVGTSALFSVAASGGGLAYQWQSSPDGVSFANIDGATGSSYSLLVAAADNGRRFRVLASNTAGSAQSELAVLTVTQAGLPPLVTQQPTDQVPREGTYAIFSVSAIGTQLAYQWQRSDDGGVSFHDVTSGGTQANYQLLATAADDGARFQVVVSNGYGRAIGGPASLNLTQEPPVFVIPPASITVVDGAVATFVVSVSGTSPSLQWQRSNDAGVSFQDIPGETGTVLRFTVRLGAVASGGDSGAQFRVAATNRAVATAVYSSVAVLTVNLVGTGLSITATPSWLTLLTTNTANINVTIHPNTGQTGGIDLTESGASSAYVTLSPALPINYQTNGVSAIVAPISLAVIAPLAQFTMQFQATEGSTSVVAPVTVLPLTPVEATLQFSNSDLRSTRTTLSASGTGYQARVDVARGQIALYHSADYTDKVNGGLGTSGRSMIFVNGTDQPIALPAGAIHFELNGTYRFVAGGSLQMNAFLALTFPTGVGFNTTTAIGTLAQTVSNQTVHVPPMTDTPPTTSATGGIQILVTQGDRNGLRASLQSPGMTIPSHQTLVLTAQLNATTATGTDASMDFSVTPAQLCLNLPAGVTLINNSVDPLNWSCP
jgi:hypothetical protein